MTRRNRLIYAFFILLLLFIAAPTVLSDSAHGAEESNISLRLSSRLAGQDLRFEHLTSEDGLPSDNVTDIVQDHQGFMWFGTFDGLVRYDGYRFKVFRSKPGDEYSLSANLIVRLHVDSDGTLWVGTSGGGLNRYNPANEQFQRYQHDPTNNLSLSNDNILAIYEDHEGVLWIGTDGGGLNRYDHESDSFKHYLNDPGVPESLSHNSVWAILDDRDGTLWVGTDGGGLNRFNRETEQFSAYRHDPVSPNSISDDSVLAVVQSTDGTIWMGTRSNGLDKFNPALESFTNFRHEPNNLTSLGDNNIMDLSLDQMGNLWIATGNGGLNKYESDTGQFLRYEPDPIDPFSTGSAYIFQLFIDSSGLIWLANIGSGVSKAELEPKAFTNIKSSPNDQKSLSNDNVLAIYEEPGGPLWLGTAGGLNRVNRKTMQVIKFVHDPENPESLSNDYIRSIVGDDEENLWLGTRDGLNRFDPKTDSFTSYSPDSALLSGLLSPSIWSLEIDSNGTLWIGTLLGLNRLDPGSSNFIAYEHNPNDLHSLSGNTISSIFEDSSGTLWFGTRGDGLNKLDQDSSFFIRYRHDPKDPESLSSDTVWDIYEDSIGNLWIGTSSGLDRYDPLTGGFERYGSEIGLPEGSIMGIVDEDILPGKDGPLLWVSTTKGLIKINIQEGTHRIYKKDDGIQGDNFNWNSVYKGIDGELFFGGSNGMTTFYPSQIKDNPHIPPIVITDFQLAHEQIEIGEDSVLQQSITQTTVLNLSYKDRVISFEFAALDYHAPNKNRYRYMLESFDDDWIEVGHDHRFITYTNLVPGDYVLRVKGSNNDGIWNEEGLAIQISIRPPWWQTSFALGISIVIMVAVLFGAYHWRVRSLESRRRELRIQVREQTDQLNQRIKELNTLLIVSRNVTASLDLDEVLYLILDQIREVVEYDVGTIRRFVHGNMELMAHRWFHPDTGSPSKVLPVDKIPVIIEMIDTRKILLIGDHQFKPSIVGPKEFIEENTSGDVLRASRTLMCVPLISKEEIIGMLVLGHRSPDRWDISVMELVQTFANQAAVAISNAELYRESKEVAIFEERARLARELHDSATQSLYSATLFSEAGKELAATGDIKSAEHFLSRVSDVVYDALKDLRLLVFQLRPSLLEIEGLQRALEQRLDIVEKRSGVESRLIVDELPPLPYRVVESLYGVAIEALNNALKHARATSMEVKLRSDGEVLTLEVIDNGLGFDVEEGLARGGLGLSNMRDRAADLRGEITIDSAPEEGTRVKFTVEIPGQIESDDKDSQ